MDQYPQRECLTTTPRHSLAQTIEAALRSPLFWDDAPHPSSENRPVIVRHSGRSLPTSLQIIEKAPRNAASIVSNTLPDTKETDRWPSDELRPQAQRYSLCTTREQPRNDASTISPTPREERLRLTLSIGGMTCAACVSSITDTLSKLNGVDEPMVDLLGNSAAMFIERESLAKTVVDAVEDCGFDARIFTLEPNQTSLNAAQGVRAQDRPLRVILSVGGMTCVACSSAVTDALSAIPGVTDPVVNLLGKSATMLVEQNNLVDVVIEAINDCGFEAELFSVDPVQPASDVDHTSAPRVISLRVDGMFSPQCPQKVMDALKPFDSRLSVLKPLDSLVDPILRLSYHPSPPDFTIRHVASCIASANSPRFQVSVCKPPSLEELGRQMQAREQRNILLRSIFAFIVAIPTFIIGIVFMSLLKANDPQRMFFMEPMWIGNASRAEWALLFLATPVMLYGSDIFHRRSFKEIRVIWRKGSTTPLLRRFTRFGSMNMLVSTGVSIAYLTSILLLSFAASRPASKERSADVTTYFDSVVFLTMFLLVGRYLEAYSKSRTADAITALRKLRPVEALVVLPKSIKKDSMYRSSDCDLEKGDESDTDETLRGVDILRVDVDLLEVGDIVRVQNGATPPADGILIPGQESAFDESSLTGESKLVQKQAGDQVFVGTINKSKPVDVRVSAIGGETMLDHIVKLVRDGQSRRAPIERVATLMLGYFVPLVTLIAVVTWLVWLILGLSGVLPRHYLDIEIGGWAVWSLQFSIAVFVVACPCGIGLAAPTALLVGSGLAAKFGILARGGGEAFQEMAQVDVVVFDKTGTLTEGGEPRVTDAQIIPLGEKWNYQLVLGIATELESASSHPLAIAIRNCCAKHHALPTAGTAFEEVPGRGLVARFPSHQCTAIIGNEAWMLEHHVQIRLKDSALLDTWKNQAKSVVLLAIRDESQSGTQRETLFRLAALFAVMDQLRSEARAVVSRLRHNGFDTWMISGDNPKTAMAVARVVGIPSMNVISGVLPHQKAEKIQRLQQFGPKRKSTSWGKIFGKSRLNERCIVAMVGDGINDAPALSASDVGIAIGSGSDVAISSAAFVLVSANLRSLLTLSDLSRKVFSRIKFNFLWALMYNLIALPVAAGVLYPYRNTRLNPIWASLAMALSSVSVVCSSLLLNTYKEPKLY